MGFFEGVTGGFYLWIVYRASVKVRRCHSFLHSRPVSQNRERRRAAWSTRGFGGSGAADAAERASSTSSSSVNGAARAIAAARRRRADAEGRRGKLTGCRPGTDARRRGAVRVTPRGPVATEAGWETDVDGVTTDVSVASSRVASQMTMPVMTATTMPPAMTNFFVVNTSSIVWRLLVCRSPV